MDLEFVEFITKSFNNIFLVLFVFLYYRESSKSLQILDDLRKVLEKQETQIEQIQEEIKFFKEYFFIEKNKK